MINRDILIRVNSQADTSGKGDCFGETVENNSTGYNFVVLTEVGLSARLHR